MHKDSHQSATYNCKELEKVKVSVTRIKQDVVHLLNKILRIFTK